MNSPRMANGNSYWCLMDAEEFAQYGQPYYGKLLSEDLRITNHSKFCKVYLYEGYYLLIAEISDSFMFTILVSPKGELLGLDINKIESKLDDQFAYDLNTYIDM